MASERDSSTEATARPWTVNQCYEVYDVVTVARDSVMTIIGRAKPGRAVQGDPDRSEANARLIVTAVNSHDDLLAACEFALAHLEHCDCSNGVTDGTGSIDEGDVRAGQFYEELRTLIARAQGGAGK